MLLSALPNVFCSLLHLVP